MKTNIKSTYFAAVIVSFVLFIVLFTIVSFSIFSKVSFNKNVKPYIKELSHVERLSSGYLKDEEKTEYENINYVTVLFLQNHFNSRKQFKNLTQIKEGEHKLIVVDFRKQTKKEIENNLGLAYPVHYLTLVKEDEAFKTAYNSITLKKGDRVYEEMRYVDRFGLPDTPIVDMKSLSEMGNNGINIYFSFSAYRLIEKKGEVSKLEIDMFSFRRGSGDIPVSGSYPIDPKKFELSDKLTGEKYNSLNNGDYVSLSNEETEFYTLTFEIKNGFALDLTYKLGDEEISFHLRVPREEIIITPKKELITIGLNGVEDGERDFKTEKGKPIDSLPTPKREGYEFLGWYLDEDFETKLRFSSQSNPTIFNEETNIYAKWEKIIEVSFVSKDLFKDVNNEFKLTEQILKGSTLKENGYDPNESEMEEFKIIGFYLDEDFTVEFSINEIITENIILYIRTEKIE